MTYTNGLTISFLLRLTYLFERQSDKEGETEDKQGQKHSSTHWFTLQMATTLQRKEQGTPPGSPHGWQRPK